MAERRTKRAEQGLHSHRCFECREYWEHRSGECHSLAERWCGCGVRWPPSNISEEILLAGDRVNTEGAQFWDTTLTVRSRGDDGNLDDEGESREQARREAYDEELGRLWQNLD